MSTTMTTNEYIGQTTRTSRPVADDARIYRDPADLAAHQARWDAAEAQRLHNQRQQDERVARVETDRAAEAAKRRAAARTDLEGAIKARFLARGDVDEADWQRLKGELIDRELISAPNPIEVEKARLRRSGAYNLF